MGSCEEVIDLTNSSFQIIQDPNDSDEIIVIDTDEYFSSSVRCNPEAPRKRKRRTIADKSKQFINQSETRRESDSSNKLGPCPICWDDLGKNPLAATKCGHIFCLKCLEKSLKQLGKNCPTCRVVLRGSCAYHPLYLN